MKYCKHCGKQIDDQATICPYCGQAVEENQEKKKEPFEVFIDTGDSLKKIKKSKHTKPAKSIKEKTSKPKDQEAPQSKSKKSKPKKSKPAKASKKKKSQPINSVPFLEKCTSKNKTSLYVLIYCVVMIIVAIVLFIVGRITKGYLSQASSLSSTSSFNNIGKAFSVISTIKYMPIVYYVILIASLVILVLSLYRFLRNRKCYLYLSYVIGLLINTLLLLYLRIVIRAIYIVTKIIDAMETNLFGSLSTYSKYEDELGSIVKTYQAHPSTYRLTVIILVIITAVMLVISIISMLQNHKKINVHSFFNAED